MRARVQRWLEMGFPGFALTGDKQCPKRLVAEARALGDFCKQATLPARNLGSWPHLPATNLHRCRDAADNTIFWCGQQGNVAEGLQAFHEALCGLRLAASDPAFWEVVHGMSQRHVP